MRCRQMFLPQLWCPGLCSHRDRVKGLLSPLGQEENAFPCAARRTLGLHEDFFQVQIREAPDEDARLPRVCVRQSLRTRSFSSSPSNESAVTFPTPESHPPNRALDVSITKGCQTVSTVIFMQPISKSSPIQGQPSICKTQKPQSPVPEQQLLVQGLL